MKKLLITLIYYHKKRTIYKFIKNSKTKLSFFDKIQIPQKVKKYVNKLLQFDYYKDIINEYNTLLEQISNHNNIINQLETNLLLTIQKNKISVLYDDILKLDDELFYNINNLLNSVYSYKFYNKYENKTLFDSYRNSINIIISNLNTIKNQKSIIEQAKKIYTQLPNKYIDYNEYTEIKNNGQNILNEITCDKELYYELPTIEYSTIEKHNTNFINMNLNDTLFDDINGISLDTEQRKSILCDEISNLVVAGAGSGKTLTICGKVKYLLDKKIANESDILLLSYSKASAMDLEKKISKISPNIYVSTFHSLGLNILNSSRGYKQTIEEQINAIITEYFQNEIKHNKNMLNRVFKYFTFFLNPVSSTNSKFEDEGKLYEDLRKRNYTTIKDKIYLTNSLKENKKTYKSEYVKSFEELTIANFLFVNGIKYEYEKPYEINTSTPNKRQYTPDFYLPDYRIYLEHYGIDKDGKAHQYSDKENEEYNASIKWKRETHKLNNTKCIETYSYEFSDGVIFDNLIKKLKDNNVKFNPLTDEQIYNISQNIFVGRNFTSFINLLITFISLYKSKFQNDQEFDELISSQKQLSFNSIRTKEFLRIAKSLYNYYKNRLYTEDKIDFDDMILQSINLLSKTSDFKFKYIIVDEFQDISQSRAKFLQELIRHSNAKLFAVGDDWQSIYRFAGSDINIFLEFDKYFNHSKTNYITTTHRNSVEIQNIVEPFITKNPYQFKKNIKSVLHQTNPIRLFYNNSNPIYYFNIILKEISSIKNSANVLVLGRNRKDIENYLCEDIVISKNMKIRHKDYQSLNITYSTVHGAKGVESDYIILIDCNDAINGFPNKIEDDPILDLILGKANAFEYAEERRLFYVALTRTKNICYIISDIEYPSRFVKEIEDKCLVYKDESILKDSNEIFCPRCKSGHLILQHYNDRIFYRCSNYPYCKYSINDLHLLTNKEKCPICGDFLIIRKGKFGKFKGCHNYPYCKYTKNI